jgi:hypothetical protein
MLIYTAVKYAAMAAILKKKAQWLSVKNFMISV